MNEKQKIIFKDFNFKLQVIDYFIGKNIFDTELNELVKKFNNIETDFSYKPIPEIVKFCEELEFTPEMLASITHFNPDGGDEIYLKIIANWDGEDHIFDIKSLEDVQYLPNFNSFDPVALIDPAIDLSPLLSCEKLEQITVFDSRFNDAIPFLEKGVTVNLWGKSIVSICFVSYEDVKILIPEDSNLVKYGNLESDSSFLLINGDYETENIDLDAPFISFENRNQYYSAYLKQESTLAIVINGNFTAKNIYNYNTDGAMGLIVLGNLKTDNMLVGGQEIYVEKNLQVNELFWGDYNHGDLTVKGKIKVNYFLQTDEYHYPDSISDEGQNGDVLINHLFLDSMLTENPMEFLDQFFVDEIIRDAEEDEEDWYTWLQFLDRSKAIALLVDNKPIVHESPKEIIKEEIPKLFSDASFSNEEDLQNQVPNFDKLIDLIPEHDPEQVFRTSLVDDSFPCQVFISRPHFSQSGSNVDAAIIVYGNDGSEFFFWKRQMNPLKRLVGKNPPLIAYYKNVDLNVFSPISIFQRPDLVRIMQLLWIEILERAEKGIYYAIEYQKVVKPDEILNMIQLPIVQELYYDWFDGDKNSFWRGSYNFCFRRPEIENEQIAILKIGVENKNCEVFDMLSYEFLIELDKNPAMAILRYRNTQEEDVKIDRYSEYGVNVSLFDSHLIKEAIKWYKIALKSVPAENLEYLINKELDEREKQKEMENLEKLRHKKFVKPYDKMMVDGIEFQVLDIHEAHQLIGELTDLQGNLLYDVYDDTWSFPNYEDNPFFLYTNNEVEVEKLELVYSTNENPDIFVLGFIFGNKLESKSYILACDIDNSPALIALSDVKSQNIHLFGNIHYVGGNMSCEVVMGEYNHGLLYVKGNLTAHFAYADDMSMYFAKADNLYASYGDTIYTLIPVIIDGENKFFQEYLPNSCSPSEILKDGFESGEFITTSMLDLEKIKKYNKDDVDAAFEAVFSNYTEQKLILGDNESHYHAMQYETNGVKYNYIFKMQLAGFNYRVGVMQNIADKSYMFSLEYYTDDKFTLEKYFWELPLEGDSLISRIAIYALFESVEHLLENDHEKPEANTNKNSNDEFRNQFGSYKIPDSLEKLLFFSNEVDFDTFSDGFYLDEYNKTGLKTYSDNPDFYNSFIEFAKANGSGSSYAFWLIDDDLENCPIVVFGDEGGIFVVAENVVQLIHLLTFDTEISIYRNAYFYRDENDDDYEESDTHYEFVDWVENNFSIQKIETNEQADVITEKASASYQAKLNDFLTKFDIDNNWDL